MTFGRGATSRVATEASSGSAWYLASSTQSCSCISFSLAGNLAPTLSFCDQSLLTSYSSHSYALAGSRIAAPTMTHGGRFGSVESIQPSW